MTATPETRNWLIIYVRSLANRRMVKRGVRLYSLCVYIMMVLGIRQSLPPIAVLGEILVSQLPILALRLVKEKAKLAKILDPRKQSWAFLADWFGLVPMLFYAALAWPGLPTNILFTGKLWPLWAGIAYVIGTLLSLSFQKGEGKVYDLLRYFTWSKLFHNGAALTALAAICSFVLVPILFTGDWTDNGHYPAFVLGFFLVWFAGAIGDAIRAGLPDDHPLKLTGKNLHAQTDEHGNVIDPEIEGVPTLHEYLTEFKQNQPKKGFGLDSIMQGREWYQLILRLMNRKS